MSNIDNKDLLNAALVVSIFIAIGAISYAIKSIAELNRFKQMNKDLQLKLMQASQNEPVNN